MSNCQKEVESQKLLKYKPYKSNFELLASEFLQPVFDTYHGSYSSKLTTKQEGHDGPGSLTWVCEPRIFKLTDFGIKRAKVIIFTNYEGLRLHFGLHKNGYLL